MIWYSPQSRVDPEIAHYTLSVEGDDEVWCVRFGKMDLDDFDALPEHGGF